MASNLNFDELSVLGSETTTKRKAIPYDEYFDEMAISYEQKKERIELAEMLDDVFFYAFALATTMKDERNNIAKLERLNSALEESLRDTMQEYGIRFDKDAYWGNYASKRAYEIARSTVNHPSDSYYTSDDRAKIIAENEANSIMNHQEFQEAKEAGYTSKIWLSEGDERVRPTHAEIDGQEIEIDKPFMVGASLMMYPMDDSLGADDMEIVGCRCSVDYGNAFDKLVEDESEDYRVNIDSDYDKLNNNYLLDIKQKELWSNVFNSDIGRELYDLVSSRNIPVHISYTMKHPPYTTGMYKNNTIYIFGDAIDTIQEASLTFIHEATHAKWNTDNSIEQEVDCFLNEKRSQGIMITQEVIQQTRADVEVKYPWLVK